VQAANLCTMLVPGLLSAEYAGKEVLIVETHCFSGCHGFELKRVSSLVKLIRLWVTKLSLIVNDYSICKSVKRHRKRLS